MGWSTPSRGRKCSRSKHFKLAAELTERLLARSGGEDQRLPTLREGASPDRRLIAPSGGLWATNCPDISGSTIVNMRYIDPESGALVSVARLKSSSKIRRDTSAEAHA